MPKIVKNLLTLLLFLSVVFTVFFVPTAKAQSSDVGPWYNQSFDQWSAKVFGGDQSEIFGERYTYAQINWIINSLTAVLFGPNVTQCVASGSTGNLKDVGDCATKLLPATNKPSSPPSGTPSLPSTPNTGMTGGAVTGLAYLTGNIISMKPASGVQYIKTTASRLHMIPEAYAQTGAGFNTLSPIQTLWSVIRNISYAFMVIVIIAMAFMIMFRVKISPQVVITIQSALPRIVVALILITFSYAIAGFLVDLMYVVVGAFSATIKIGGTSISNGSVTYLFEQLNSVNGLVSLSIGIAIFAILLAVGGALLFGASVPATFIVPVLGTGGTLIGSVVVIVFAIFLLFILFRLFWLMVKTAAETVLLIVAGPIMILLGTFSPSGGFSRWIRSLLANLAIYPTVTIMIFLSHYFFWGWAAGGFTQLWPNNNPLNTYAIQALNLNGGSGIVNLPGMPLSTAVLGFALSFVILFLIPRAAHIIEAMIEGKRVDVGGAAAQGAGPLATGVKYGVVAGVGKVGSDIVSNIPAGPAQQSGNTILQGILKRLG